MIEIIILLILSTIFFLRANEKRKVEYWIITLFTTGVGTILITVQSVQVYALTGFNILLFLMSIVLLFLDIIDQGNFITTIKKKKFKKNKNGK